MFKIKKVLKRAFTIVELVVVIAVIAALAAILIPTFANVISAANESADQQAVKNMNTALYTEEKTSGTPVNPSDAMAVIEEAGYTVKDYVAQQSENTIYWDSSTNRCLIFNSETNKVTYPSDAVSKYADTAYTSDNIPTFWYTLSDAYVTKVYDSTTTTFAEAVSALADGETLQLKEDVTVDYVTPDTSTTVTIGGTVYNVTGINALMLQNGESKTIDLNGYTLTSKTKYTLEKDGKNYTSRGTLTISDASSLYIKNGTLADESGVSGSNSMFSVEAGSCLTLENVNVTSSASVLFPNGDAAQVNVINSTITTSGVYCVGTNAATTDNYNVAIRIENSTLTTTASDYDSCVVMINVVGTLDISDSTLIGQRQGVLVRAGTATITDTTISCSITATAINNYNAIVNRTDYSSTWDQGNEVSMGAVVVGNDTSNSYLADAKLTMSGCTLSYTITGDSSNAYSEYNIALALMRKNSTTYKTDVTISDTTISGYVINLCGDGCTSNLTGYSGTVYTTWNSTSSKWE